MKNGLGNLAARDVDQLAAIMKNRLKRIQYRPALIEAFLAQTGLTLNPSHRKEAQMLAIQLLRVSSLKSRIPLATSDMVLISAVLTCPPPFMIRVRSVQLIRRFALTFHSDPLVNLIQAARALSHLRSICDADDGWPSIDI